MTTYNTKSAEYLSSVNNIIQTLSNSKKYPDEVIKTVKTIALNRNPHDSINYMEPALKLPDFEGQEGLNYYKLITQADKNGTKSLIPTEVGIDEVLAPTPNSKIFFTLGLDAGTADNIAKYVSDSGRLGILIDCLRGNSLEEKLRGFYFINHKMTTQNKFKLTDETLANRTFNHVSINKFYDEFFSKILQNNSHNNLNKTIFINHSFGSMFIEAAQIMAIKSLQAEGLNNSQIQQKFDNLTIIQFGAPSLSYEQPQPRIPALSINSQADMLYPTPEMIFPTTDEGGAMLADFEIFPTKNNPAQSTIFLNQNLSDKSQMNFGAHYLPRYIDVCFGSEAPESFREFFTKLITNVTPDLFRGLAHLLKLQDNEKKLLCQMPEQVRHDKSLENLLKLYCQQLVEETIKWTEIKYKNGNAPKVFNAQNHPHRLIQKLGF
jgi:hypothetical protein